MVNNNIILDLPYVKRIFNRIIIKSKIYNI